MNAKKNKKDYTILLIDDDQGTVKIVKFMLEQEKYKVLVAEDGEKALEMLDYPVDLILLDLVMPKVSGFEVLKVIKQKKKFAAPVIIFSNLGKDNDIKKALDSGADGYLIKSQFSAQNLKKKIKEVLDRQIVIPKKN